MSGAPPAQAVIDAIVAVKPALRPGDVHPDASLTRDLGLDSLDLVQLAARITAAYPDFELRAWLTEAMASEVDSVHSMARMLEPVP
ncbi:acyl carrier protein [Actinoplanes sp. NPDC051859]|uniref:acyl carrier protein n=1 Tax=Actinoplanes sp. NPDC051859 TaxID=3363909 RepID=UPI003799E5AB